MEQIVETDLKCAQLFELIASDDLTLYLFFCDSTIQRCLQFSRSTPNVNIMVTELETCDMKPGKPKRNYVWESQFPILCLDETELGLQRHVRFLFNTTRFFKFRIMDDYSIPPCIRRPYPRCCENGPDFTVMITEHEFKLCRRKLCDESDYFAAMLRTECKEATENECRLDDVDPDIFGYLVLYLKSGGVCGATVAKRLHILADRFQMPKLRKLCERWIIASMNEVNMDETLQLAETSGSLKFYKAVIDRAAWNLRCSAAKFDNESKPSTIRSIMDSNTLRDYVPDLEKCQLCSLRIPFGSFNAESHIRRRHATAYYSKCLGLASSRQDIQIYPTIDCLMRCYETVKIRIGEWNFTICKADICTESELISKLFKQRESNFKQRESNEIKIKNADPKIFSALLKYIYYDEVEDSDPVAEILHLAIRLEMPHIVTRCVLRLVEMYKGQKWLDPDDYLLQYRISWI